MFTGIVESVGTIKQISETLDRMDVTIETGSVETNSVGMGDSICVSGICLTVTRIRSREVDFFVSNETIARSRFSSYKAGTRVNLELSLSLNKRLGGHIVSGHVDGLVKCVGSDKDGDSKKLTFEVKLDLGKYVAKKGSVSLDGVSMTVNEVIDNAAGTRFSVNVIPHTLSATTLGDVSAGDHVHIEVDVLARYAERFRDIELRI